MGEKPSDADRFMGALLLNRTRNVTGVHPQLTVQL